VVNHFCQPRSAAQPPILTDSGAKPQRVRENRLLRCSKTTARLTGLSTAWLTAMICLCVRCLRRMPRNLREQPRAKRILCQMRSRFPFVLRENGGNYFVHETVSPLTLGGSTFNAAFSQVTNTDPKYGVDSVAFGKRFGASIADIVSQNFFGDFVVASVFHEDPRYFRMGERHSLKYRAGYAISRRW